MHPLSSIILCGCMHTLNFLNPPCIDDSKVGSISQLLQTVHSQQGCAAICVLCRLVSSGEHPGLVELAQMIDLEAGKAGLAHNGRGVSPGSHGSIAFWPHS